jgi:hypothetical protein
MNGETNITFFPLCEGVPLDLLEDAQPWDGQAFLDGRRDAYLAEEAGRIDGIMAAAEGLTKADLLRMVRAALVAGVRMKSDEVMLAQQAEREEYETALDDAKRRLAMKRELQRQARESEVPEWARTLRREPQQGDLEKRRLGDKETGRLGVVVPMGSIA